ncbi:MAG: phage tail protein [Pseudomonadota bacterium]
MATMVLTAVGTALGGPIGGAIGGLIGNVLDREVLFKAKGREGARLSDLQLQTSSYGTQMPRLFGTMRVAGTVIWATDLREIRTKSGGGKGQGSSTSYSYSASFAVALSARGVRSIGRIWADGNLLRGAAGDFKTQVGAFRLHDGGEDQAPDPLIASAQGAGMTPAHRGIAYVVFEDLLLSDYGNRIPSLTFEVEADAGAVTIEAIVGALSEGQMGCVAESQVEGFAASGADLSEAIAPLVEAYGLGLCGDGAQLVGEAGPVVALLDPATRCRRINGRAIDPVERSGAGADSVALALSVRHHDPARDYQAGVQRVTRPGPGRIERGIELPAVLSGGAARSLARQRLDGIWTGRDRMTVRGDWRALELEPGMIVTLADAPGLWRIEEREWEAMAVRLALRRLAGAGGRAPGSVSSGQIVRQVDAPHGPTRLMLADLPRLTEGVANGPQLVAAASGGPGWRSAALYALDAGGTAEPIGRTAPRAVMGQIDAALPPGSTLLLDTVNSLSVTLLAEDMELASADGAALAQGRNLCLVGQELIQFSRAVRTGPASYRLEELRRGLRGTEWAMAGQGGGTSFLLIEADRLVDPLAVAGMEGDIGAAMRLLAIGIGDVEPATAEVMIGGAALVPPAPVHLDAAPDGAGGWRIGWTRRSRAGWRWSSGGDVPLAEESERYELRVLDGARLVRRAEVTEPGWTYDAAMIAMDGVSGPLSMDVRQVGTRALGRPGMIERLL